MMFRSIQAGVLALNLFLGVVFGLVQTQSHAQTLPPGVTKSTSVEGITEYQLANGMKVLLASDPSKPSIVVNITYLVGSRHENYGETGMAHLLEHMLFKGSKNHPKIAEEFTQRGAQWNATTWTDRTNYYEVFTASEDNLDWALGLEADRMLTSFIRKEDLATEMPVVRNEFEIGENSPVDIMIERMISTMYLWHNYGKSTIGARSDIENVPVPRLQAFYRNYYQPDNAVLLIGGRFDDAKALAMVVKHFGSIPKPTRVLQALYTQEPVQDGERSVKLERVGDVQAVGAGHHVPQMAHPDYAAVTLLTDVLANVPSGRLHKTLVETNKATSVSSYNFDNRDPSAMMVWATLRKEQSRAEAKEGLLKVIDGFAKEPVTAAELDRAKSKSLKAFELTMTNSERLGLQLSEAIGAGDWRLFFLHRDHIRNAKLEDVQRAALTYLKSANRTLGEFIPTQKPERAEIPKIADVAAVVKDFKGDPPIAKGEAFDATPDNIEKRVKRGQLPSGIKTALLAKRTRGETVSASIVLRFGDEVNLKGQRVNADAVSNMLMRGTAKKNREQLREAIDNLKASINVGGTATRSVVRVTAKRDTLIPALKLVSEMLRESNFPEKEFELMRKEALANIEAAASDPQSLAYEALNAHYNIFAKDDPRYSSTLKESEAEYKALKLDEAKAFYRDFYGANNGELAIVGDFDEKEINALLPQLFGDWKSSKTFKRLTTDYKAVAATKKAIETPDKESATFIARTNVNLKQDDPDYPAMLIANYMLGDGAGFSARLVARIRVKEGLSYSVSSDLDVNGLDNSGEWAASAQYAPQNREKVLAAFKDEMQILIKDGFPIAEVVASKAGYAQAQALSRASDANLANLLTNQLSLNRTLQWDDALDKKVAALKPADIQAAMKKYLNINEMTYIDAGDFAKTVTK
jgi:zinc protease